MIKVYFGETKPFFEAPSSLKFNLFFNIKFFTIMSHDDETTKGSPLSLSLSHTHTLS